MADCCAHNEDEHSALAAEAHSLEAVDKEVVDALKKFIVDDDLTDEAKLRLESFEKKRITENLNLCSIIFEVPNAEFVPENHVHDSPPLENRLNRFTPLMWAVFKERNAIVQYLIESFSPNLEVEGTIVLDHTPVEGVTALWLAVSFHHPELASLLLEHGAQINHCTK